ncbi:MAG: YidC/Oxa1 family insertase periplasmic-domain containing protein [Phycisphaerae bacterium]|nr:YidC/Oxa1 family insertase periplasmic-domain containing protein [Phycisphaerae bacterium]
MSPGLRKFLVTMTVVAVAIVVLATVLRGKPPAKTAPEAPVTPATSSDAPATSSGAPNGGADGGASGETTPPAQPSTPAATPAAAPATDGAAASAATPPTATSFVARAPIADRTVSAARPATAIGSLDPNANAMRITFAPNAAGIAEIVFSNLWKNASARVAAARHLADPSRPAPPDDERYVLAQTISVLEGTRTFDVPVLGTHSIEVNGTLVSLFGSVWSETAPGSFTTEIVDASGTAVARVDRVFSLGRGYDIQLSQTVTNLSAAPLRVRWTQYGPGELAHEPTAYVDARRMQFGYLLPPDRDPTQDTVLSAGQLFERSAILKLLAANPPDLWPDAAARDGRYRMSWFASKNRYFCVAVHAPWTEAAPVLTMENTVEHVRIRGNGREGENLAVLSEMHSAVREIAPSGKASFDMGVFAGPLDRQMLATTDPFAALGMDQAVVYMLSSCCTACTFSWLANFMAWFLTLLHNYVVFDWGLAIIVLVILVRLALHPLMKRSQIQMQRFGRQMAELKPELDALQKRYAGDSQKIQSEQMRLYREKGINPVGCISGILPTFLQMPIWIALYAVLFYAWDLRQAPAFFGVFQLFNGWTFLGDLSLSDNFFVFSQPINLWLFSLTSINLLPLLMGFVFFLQQKYMSPPTPNMTPEQEQQQKIMKVMMVLMFPIMLYKAPSGLTLYILTSTCIGIWESRMVKKHIDQYGIAGPAKGDGTKKQDRLGKMYESMLDRARQKQAEKNKRTFKERD